MKKLVTIFSLIAISILLKGCASINNAASDRRQKYNERYMAWTQQQKMYPSVEWRAPEGQAMTIKIENIASFVLNSPLQQFPPPEPDYTAFQSAMDAIKSVAPWAAALGLVYYNQPRPSTHYRSSNTFRETAVFAPEAGIAP